MDTKILESEENEQERQKTGYWKAVKCPKCGSENTYVNGTRKPVRYLICRDCGEHFKAV